MKLFDEIEGLVSSQMMVIKNMFSIVTLEAKLAGLSVFPFLVNVCMLLIVLMTTWFFTMTIVGYFAYLAFDNLLYTLFFILFLNAIVFIGLLKYLLFNLRNMSFEKTRAFLAKKENEHEQENQNTGQVNHTGKELNIPT